MFCVALHRAVVYILHNEVLHVHLHGIIAIAVLFQHARHGRLTGLAAVDAVVVGVIAELNPLRIRVIIKRQRNVGKWFSVRI
ncbi:hypothetical protein SDC9_96214 [bioreactor metagenome]|uniref:Uncharacterized protein n=1 Tax=bioreactor metagenome TaxID=1076179 RepID=A0A645AIK2_9ZZZZ